MRELPANCDSQCVREREREREVNGTEINNGGDIWQPYLQDVDWINPYKTLDSVEREMTEQGKRTKNPTKKKLGYKIHRSGKP